MNAFLFLIATVLPQSKSYLSEVEPLFWTWLLLCTCAPFASFKDIRNRNQFIKHLVAENPTGDFAESESPPCNMLSGSFSWRNIISETGLSRTRFLWLFPVWQALWGLCSLDNYKMLQWILTYLFQLTCLPSWIFRIFCIVRDFDIWRTWSRVMIAFDM